MKEKFNVCNLNVLEVKRLTPDDKKNNHINIQPRKTTFILGWNVLLLFIKKYTYIYMAKTRRLISRHHQVAEKNKKEIK